MASAKKAMTKGQLVGHFAEKFSLTRAQSTEVFAELAKVAAKEAKNGFTIPDIGKLVMVKRKARMGRNPQTGEAIQIPARTVLKFRIAKACKDAVLGGKK
jgi:DNA-binding protein HU-beta